MEIALGHITRKQARGSIFVVVSLVFVSFLTLSFDGNVNASSNASLFLGPPLGETILLDNGDGGDQIDRIMRGEEDLMNNYTLQATNSTILSTNVDGTSMEIDFLHMNGTIHGHSTRGDTKIDFRVVGEKEERVHGKIRKIITLEANWNLEEFAIKDVYTIASGLWLIRSETLSGGEPFVSFKLKEE